MDSKRKELEAILSKIKNPKREYRSKAAEEISKKPELFKSLLETIFENNKDFSQKASWCLEWITKENRAPIYDNLDLFLDNVQKPKDDTIVRPLAKVCELLAYDFMKSNGKSALKEDQIEKIVEVCFDWMISDRKVAVEAYSMQTIFVFRNTQDWITDELINILEKNMPNGSAGYKARGKRILEAIEKERATL
ncbi:adenylosuccinate lyase [Aureivirga sp. CE67]|uniref:adenylosuccinate lyase n=1 Tax=Aureivirga sp. CE67 TaxID=1788983 RepID=UPI0018CAAE5D|nr:adenylosuccinate lyase [Aureivirga sp. CE67]